MIKLINKGGFRERANRSKKYQHSENQQTVLNPKQYTPTASETPTPQEGILTSDQIQPKSLNHLDHINP